MPPPARRNRTVWIIVLIALGLLVLAASVVVPFFTSITTAEVLQVDKDIELPVARAEKKQEAPRAGEYFLNLKWENGKGVFRFLDKDYEDEQALVAELEKVRTSVPGCRLIVRGDQRLPAIEIQRAMKVMSSAGFDAITFSTADPK